MRYNDLIQFDPIVEVVKLHLLENEENRKRLVRTFVYSDAYISQKPKGNILRMCDDLDYSNPEEHFGIQVVGSYGTGKSHLMSLVSIVAEDENYLQYVSNDIAKQALKKIAGRYNVIRFELGATESLWKLVCYQIDKYLQSHGVNYSIMNDNTPDMYIDKLQRMMAAYEAVVPDKGLLIIIDEMLAYLRGRSDGADLNQDLQVLQALGQMCDGSKFRIIFGVQELIYSDNAFQFASDMLNKVSDRYLDITITKQDVQFVVQNRLLKKDEHQKQAIREHLRPYTKYFSDLAAQFETYVNLFPVSPMYVENFQQIRIGKSQREILKTLSNRFDAIKDDEVPNNNPGLICYDEYWDDMKNIASLQSNADVRCVKEVMENIDQKIESNFTGGRAAKKPLAHRIANACAIKILQAELNVANGATAENLIDDLCYIDSFAADRDMLRDIIDTTANNIVKFTMGQFFDKSENGEYHLRTEGGINYEQQVKDFAGQMPNGTKDQYFYQYLAEMLPIEIEPYKTGFKIYSYELPWISHKVTRKGYIFMGCKNERSTTQPERNFYLYFLPLFAEDSVGDEADSVYVRLNKLNADIKEKICLWAASRALENSVPTNQKENYKQLGKRYFKELRNDFNEEFWKVGEMVYQGASQPLSSGGTGSSKLEEVCRLASICLEENFYEQAPDYPKFELLQQPMNYAQNREAIVRGALQKIANFSTQNRPGEALLAGLGLINDNQLSTSTSMYARSIAKMIEEKGGQVLNKDELLYQYWTDDYRSKDFDIEDDLEFVVLAAMVAQGEIEIVLPQGKTINAGNINEVVSFSGAAFHNFNHVRLPKGANMAAIKEIFRSVVGVDLSGQMEHDPSVFSRLLTAAKEMAGRAAKTSHLVHDGLYLSGTEIISPSKGGEIARNLEVLKGYCDKVCNFNTVAKMKNQPYTLEDLQKVTKFIPDLERTEQMLEVIGLLREKTSYLDQAKQYVTDDQLKKDIEQAIESVGKIKDFGVKAECDRCEQALQAQCEAYAEWYLKEYLRCHINENKYLEKQKLQQSEANWVCQAVSEADILPNAPYTEWTHVMSKLRLADSHVNKERILESPYQSFNPHDYKGVTIKDVSMLKEELGEIYSSYDTALHQMLDDPGIQKNMDALDANTRTMLQKYKDGKMELDQEHAKPIISAIAKLHKGITKVILTAADLPKIFTHPMSKEEALAALGNYIEQQLHGQDRSNIRVIFK